MSLRYNRRYNDSTMRGSCACACRCANAECATRHGRFLVGERSPSGSRVWVSANDSLIDGIATSTVVGPAVADGRAGSGIGALHHVVELLRPRAVAHGSHHATAE